MQEMQVRAAGEEVFQYSCLKNPVDLEAWWAIHSVESQTGTQLNC